MPKTKVQKPKITKPNDVLLEEFTQLVNDYQKTMDEGRQVFLAQSKRNSKSKSKKPTG